VLTIIAALTPIGFTAYHFQTKSSSLRFSLISALFAILFISCFYIYFKGTNELFYRSFFNDNDLKTELVTWAKWHWGRIVLESLSLLFLILAVAKRE
jgi:hypothetical protein